MVDPDGFYSVNRDGSYSGIIGFGIEILISLNAGMVSVFGGIDIIWFFPKNNFGNKLVPWTYLFYGGGYGINIDFSKLLNPNILNNPKALLKMLNLNVSASITFFLITAKSFKNPYDYKGNVIFNQYTAFGITYSSSRDLSNNVRTYGVGAAWTIGSKGFGLKTFGAVGGGARFYPVFFGPGAQSLYSLAKSRC